ncbi:hypothetical protein [Bailinhaonella thermotolerans]|uniref:Uncharacterized protein n=1 Tax=Bailinhaonella thermotolerans TaxID=1070861 RepID=A0A3A4B5M7_9ACTN|nr:hypothetical protein [Bailinhaonella thermotolerans]RJL35930.1 hypothetical protein D5H75_03945 [Bailinhaonella thermotolerans]
MLDAREAGELAALLDALARDCRDGVLGDAAARTARVLRARAAADRRPDGAMERRDAGDLRDGRAEDRDRAARDRDARAERRDARAGESEAEAGRAEDAAVRGRRRVRQVLREADARARDMAERAALPWPGPERAAWEQAEIEREMTAAHRELEAEERRVIGRALDEAAEAGTRARRERAAAELDRQAAAGDRRTAAEDRGGAAADRRAAQADRDQNVIDSEAAGPPSVGGRRSDQDPEAPDAALAWPLAGLNLAPARVADSGAAAGEPETGQGPHP